MNNRLTLGILKSGSGGEKRKVMKKFLTVFLCALCLAGCGKRGKLDFPKGTVYPRQYPAARQPKSAKETAISVEQKENAGIPAETEGQP